MRRKWIFLAPMAILAMLLFIAIGGEVVLQLWNWLLPSIFGWRQITFWQAVGILALCRILFGGFGHRGFYRSNFRRRMDERWGKMNGKESGNACGNVAASAHPPARARGNDAMPTHSLPLRG
jgi:hypothetical protein